MADTLVVRMLTERNLATSRGIESRGSFKHQKPPMSDVRQHVSRVGLGPAEAEVTKTVIICGNLFDGLGDTTRGPAEILIEDATIAEVSVSVGRPDARRQGASYGRKASRARGLEISP
jgi:hypothetical protein